jgi:hypothetical protein
MQSLQLRTKRSDAEIAKLLGQQADARDFGVLLTESARVYKPNGEMLLVYLRAGKTETNANLAYPFLHSLRTATSANRGMYAGRANARSGIKKDGKQSKTNSTAPIRSAIVGNFDRSARYPFCRQTALATQHPQDWPECLPMIQEVARLMQKHAPARYAAQLDAANKTHPAYVLPDSPFTTITVNNTVAGGYHTDAGDFKPGFGVMSVLRRGKYQGGLLVVPAYGVAVDLQERDVLLFDVHEVHGNTPLVGEGPACEPENGGHERISIVYYFREKMPECLSPADELDRAKNLRGSLDDL